MLRRLSQSSYSKSFFIAVGLHGAVLFTGGWALTQKAEFGMEVGRSSFEVDLVAAPQELQPVESTPEIQSEPPVGPMITPSEATEFVLPEKVEEQSQITEGKPKPVEKPKLIVKNQEPSPYQGDESSPKPGKDSTTIYSTEGAVSEAKPDYLKNPPPAYPEIARKLGQEGVVLLTAEINAEGSPHFIKVKESSGVRSLDEAALKAVQKWKFSPAKTGSIAVEAKVDIPIKFQLKN